MIYCPSCGALLNEPEPRSTVEQAVHQYLTTITTPNSWVSRDDLMRALDGVPNTWNALRAVNRILVRMGVKREMRNRRYGYLFTHPTPAEVGV